MEHLERLIDEFNGVVGDLTNFLLPGGSPGAAQLHVARTICRRAEREAVRLGREEAIGELVLPYLNRLSDALFVMARFENHERGVAEPLWQPGAEGGQLAARSGQQNSASTSGEPGPDASGSNGVRNVKAAGSGRPASRSRRSSASSTVGRCPADPPQHQVGGRQSLEPLPALAQDLDVRRGVREGAERLDRRPDAHVDEEQVVLGRPDVGGVARVGLQPPDEARARSARRLIGSSSATNPAISGDSTGASIRPTFSCASSNPSGMRSRYRGSAAEQLEGRPAGHGQVLDLDPAVDEIDRRLGRAVARDDRSRRAAGPSAARTADARHPSSRSG